MWVLVLLLSALALAAAAVAVAWVLLTRRQHEPAALTCAGCGGRLHLYQRTDGARLWYELRCWHCDSSRSPRER